ncbi:MAG: quinolinate synthase NadA [Fibrobacteres bacterium]|nr:quinolinate synthase NadA [Fibrobacterota bacterium]
MDEALVKEIAILKKQHNAVILAHNYESDEIQAIADYTGDSLGLSRTAAKTDADVIVFCGVFFMAETAKILSPQKKVLLPDLNAGCPMADMITAEKLRAFKAANPGRTVICYVNSTAEVKAESDICCTSANAIDLVKALPVDEKILFVPDMHLGRFVAEKTGRDIICWKGFCPTHMKITADVVRSARQRHPLAIVLIHPECMWEAVQEADEALSTGQMLAFVKKSEAKEFVIATEKGILYQLRKDNPGKEFYMASPDIVCPNMKKINLLKVRDALLKMQYEVTVDRVLAVKAKQAIDRML